MIRFLSFVLLLALLASCRSTRTITAAMNKKDTTVLSAVPEVNRVDTQALIRQALLKVDSNKIDYRTFIGKIDVDFRSTDGKNNSVKVNVRMIRDSVIWMNVNASVLGIDVMRVLITRDSVKLVNKLDKVYTERSVGYLQEMTALPLDLKTVQDLIVGNPVFLDSNITSYNTANGQVNLLSLGVWFRNLLTLSEGSDLLLHSKLDDTDPARSRTADLTYSDYETKKGFPFSTKRQIVVTEKNRLDIKLDFKQYELNGEVSMPFSIPRGYARK